MAFRQADVAIRRHYFEDTLMLIAEFNVLGHEMNYVLRISSFGSRSDGQNIQVYFGLLDDTMRDFTEARYVYDADQIMVDRKKLLIRAENVEINETFQGLKVFIKSDAVTLDFLAVNDGHRKDIRSLEELEINNRLEGYAYPYCTTEGTALIGTNYCDLHGTAFYGRRYQNRGGRLDRRTGQTSILRSFSRSEPEPQNSEATSLYGTFVLSDGKRFSFGTFGDGKNQDDVFVLTAGNNMSEVKILPIRTTIEDTGDPEHPDKDVTLYLQSEDPAFSLKARRVLTLNEGLSPDKKDFRLYDRFARLSGTFEGEKVHGYGCLIMT